MTAGDDSHLDAEFHGSPYVEIPDEHWTGTVKEMRERADKAMRSFKPAHNPHLGEIHFTKRGRSKTLGTKTTPHQFQSVQALPALIEHGAVASSVDDNQGRYHIVKIHTIEHGLKIGESHYKAEIIVREVRTGSKTSRTAHQFCLHKLQDKKADSRNFQSALSGETSSPASHKKPST
jgi:hypothetical protein